MSWLFRDSDVKKARIAKLTMEVSEIRARQLYPQLFKLDDMVRRSIELLELGRSDEKPD